MSVLEYPRFSGHPQSSVSHEQTTCPLQITTQDLPHSSPLAFIALATDMPVKPNAKTFLPLPICYFQLSFPKDVKSCCTRHLPCISKYSKICWNTRYWWFVWKNRKMTSFIIKFQILWVSTSTDDCQPRWHTFFLNGQVSLWPFLFYCRKSNLTQGAGHKTHFLTSYSVSHYQHHFPIPNSFLLQIFKEKNVLTCQLMFRDTGEKMLTCQQVCINNILDQVSPYMHSYM